MRGEGPRFRRAGEGPRLGVRMRLRLGLRLDILLDLVRIRRVG